MRLVECSISWELVQDDEYPSYYNINICITPNMRNDDCLHHFVCCCMCRVTYKAKVFLSSFIEVFKVNLKVEV